MNVYDRAVEMMVIVLSEISREAVMDGGKQANVAQRYLRNKIKLIQYCLIESKLHFDSSGFFFFFGKMTLVIFN